jgi:D-aspartate ligase
MQGRGAIVVGGYVNGLGIVRALADRGVPVAVVTTQPYDLAQRSRWCVASCAAHAIGETPDALPAALDAWRTRFPGWALLPTADDALVAIARHHDTLAKSFRPIAPPEDVVRRLVDKTLLLDAARAAGVDLPHCWGPATLATVARDELRFPLLVKPVVGYRFVARFGVKLFCARDRAELRAAVERVASAGLDAEIFDLVPGDDDQIWSYTLWVDERGEPGPGVTVRKIRQSPARFGVARVACAVDDLPHLRDATIAVARQLDLRGAVSAEFKRDPRDGRFRFLEINGRSVIYNALLRRAGHDVAALAWSEHVERAPLRQNVSGWRGTWINLHADVLNGLLRRDEALGLRAFGAPYRSPMIEAVWSWRDPAPFAAQWGRTMRLAARQLRPTASAVRRPRET